LLLGLVMILEMVRYVALRPSTINQIYGIIAILLEYGMAGKSQRFVLPTGSNN